MKGDKQHDLGRLEAGIYGEAGSVYINRIEA